MLFNPISINWNSYLKTVNKKIDKLSKNHFTSLQVCMPTIDLLSKINAIVKREISLSAMQLETIQNHILTTEKFVGGKMLSSPPILIAAEDHLNKLLEVRENLNHQKKLLEKILNHSIELTDYEVTIADLRCDEISHKVFNLKKQIQVISMDRELIKSDLEEFSRQLRSEIKRWYEQQDYYLTRLTQAQNNIEIRKKLLRDFEYCHTDQCLIDEYQRNITRFKQEEAYAEIRLEEAGKALIKLNLTKKVLYHLFNSLKEMFTDDGVRITFPNSKLSYVHNSLHMQRMQS